MTSVWQQLVWLLCFIPNLFIRNLSPKFMFGGCQLWVWHSFSLLLMALKLTSFCPLLIMTPNLVHLSCSY
jgi:hypothetical protein